MIPVQGDGADDVDVDVDDQTGTDPVIVNGHQSGRAATESALERAATKLLERDGVLAGLNLREVANEAGVNRGLVYHYYGSRGKLLRRALRRGGQRSMSELTAHRELPFLERWRQFYLTIVAHPEPIALTTLLVLDGTEPIRTMPLRDHTREGLLRDVAMGDIDPEVDLVALHALLVASVFGYAIYREPFAREMGVDVDELDARVDEFVFTRLLKSVVGAGAGTDGTVHPGVQQEGDAAG